MKSLITHHPLNFLNILYSPSAMILAQFVIILPVVASLSQEILSGYFEEYKSKEIKWVSMNSELSINEKEIDSCFALVGAKASAFFKSVGGNVIAVAEKLGDKPNPDDLIGLTKVVLDMHKNGDIDQAYLCSNTFVNTMTQQPNVDQLIPLAPEEQTESNPTQWDYIYEPEAKELLDGLLTRYIESLVYQAVIENNACEQAAKMIAMKNATDNAGDLIKELELLYNNVRQAAITQELSEIVGGASAV